MTTLTERLADVDVRIATAVRSAGRDLREITRIVVTKFHPALLVRELAAAGVTDVGENRQQELTAKRAELTGIEDLRWHFIGQAQTNKARQIRAAADVVHSVDRVRLADALHAAGDGAPVLDVLLQINLTEDPGRGGVAPADLERLAEHVLRLDTLRLRGVMAVAPLDEDPEPAFARVAELSQKLRALAPTATWISAGMSHDFPAAISHGATHLRIGSAITGQRPAQG